MLENSFTSSSSPEKSEGHSNSSSSGKKRRKQSNPTRYGNTTAAEVVNKKSKVSESDGNEERTADEEAAGDLMSRQGSGSLSDEAVTREDPDSDRDEDEEDEDLRSRADIQYFCPHCPASFPTDELIKAHIEEEHVLQLLERQLRQYQFGRNSSSSTGPGQNGSASRVTSANLTSEQQQELTEHQLSLLMRPLRPASRTSSHSSSLSQPESPTSRHRHAHQQLARDCMDRETMAREFGNMLPFPLSAGIPSLGPGPDGKGSIPIGLFPPFLFPVLPGQGASGAGSSGNVPSAAGQNRSPGGSIPTGAGSFCIFNPEAYCELCNKEFCNKYFLKTHKANKHGIYTGDATPATASATGTGPSCSNNNNNNNNNNCNGIGLNNSNNSNNNNSSSNSSPGPGATSNSSNSGIQHQAQAAVSAAAAAASAFFPAGLLHQSPVPSPSSQQPSPSQVSRMLGQPPNPESYCEICQKGFCNKYFLKKHKQKIHGIHFDSNSQQSVQQSQQQQPQQTSQSQSQDSLSPGRTSTDLVKVPSPAQSPSDLISAMLHSRQQMHQQQQRHVHQSLSNGNDSANGGIDPFSGIGLNDFCNKYFAKGSGNSKQKMPPDMFDIQSVVNSIQKAAASAGSHSQLQSTDGGGMSGSAISPLKRSLSDSGSRSPTPNQSTIAPVSSPKNYCNICNKELCNKYFMKTHMLKMHGINIDEQPGEAAQASTIGGVTCDVCQKELCSKYFLKVHKQNTHGIYEESSGRGDGRGSGSRTSASSSHSISASGAIASAADVLGIAATVASEIQNEKDSPARGIDPKDTNNRYFSHYTEVCPYCQRRFKSIKWLKTHLMNDHSELPSVRGQNSEPMLTLPPPALPQNPSPQISHDISDNSERDFSYSSGRGDGRHVDPRSGSTGTTASETLASSSASAPDHQHEKDSAIASSRSNDSMFNDNTEVCPLCQRRFESMALIECKKQMLMIMKHLERFLRD